MNMQIVPSSTAILPFTTDILAGRLAESSIAVYSRDIKKYLEFAGTQERALDSSVFSEWLTHLATYTTFSPNTINRMMTAVKRFMDEAEEKHYIDTETNRAFKKVRGVNAIAMKERLKKSARTRVEPESMRLMTSKPDTSTLPGLRDAALLHTLASSGLRLSELASLTPEQIVKRSNDYLLLVTGKTDILPREAPLSTEAYVAIQAWLAKRTLQSAFIFNSFESKALVMRDGHMTGVAVWMVVKKYAEQCGLKNVKPHDFRRFVGTTLAKQDIRKAQRALGHKSIDTTAKHYDLAEMPVGMTENLY